MKTTAFEADVLGRVADDYEAVHTICGDLERNLDRPVSDEEVASALENLADAGLVDRFILDQGRMTRQPSSSSIGGEVWYYINDSGRAEMKSMANYINPASLPAWTNFFTQVVATEGLVLVSGQVGVNTEKELAGDGSFEAQVKQAFENLAAALAAAGAAMSDVAKLSVFVVNYTPAHAGPIAGVIKKHFEAGKPPACTLLGVQSLADPRFLIEVEAYAVVSRACAS